MKKEKLITNNWLLPTFYFVIIAIYLAMFLLPHNGRTILLGPVEQSLWRASIITFSTPPVDFSLILIISIFGLVAGTWGFCHLIGQAEKGAESDRIYLIILFGNMVVFPILFGLLTDIFYEPIGILACFIISTIASTFCSSLILLFVPEKK